MYVKIPLRERVGQSGEERLLKIDAAAFEAGEAWTGRKRKERICRWVSLADRAGKHAVAASTQVLRQRSLWQARGHEQLLVPRLSTPAFRQRASQDIPVEGILL